MTKKLRQNTPEQIKKRTLSGQILITLYSNYYRLALAQKRKPAKYHEADLDRIEAELSFIRVAAEVYKVPQWKIIDVILHYGIARFIEEKSEEFKLELKRERAALDEAEKIFNMETSDMMQEYRYELGDKRLKEILDAATDGTIYDRNIDEERARYVS